MLTQSIYAHAREMPDKIAVVFDNRRLSYGEFAAAIEAWRRLLLAEGIAGDGVAVVAIQSVLNGWIAGLALRSLGLTTVVPPTLEQIAGLGLPETRCVVTVEGEIWPGLRRLCKRMGWRLVSLPKPDLAGGPRVALSDRSDWPARLGQRILLTAGTTGAYKKILSDRIGDAADPHMRRNSSITEHSVVNVLNYGLWTAIGYNMPARTWLRGGTVLFCERLPLHATFRYPGITRTSVIPDFLRQILAAPPGELTRNDEMLLTVTGGALSQAQFEAAKARLTAQIYTTIGTTEVGAYTMTRIETLDDLYWHRVIPECEVQVVDDAGRPLPFGELGRIRVRVTDGTTGYLHDESATQEFFEGGYFYPGDLGLFRADGRLALHGRKTEVINILGYKIAPGPIERRLVDEGGVTGACLLSGRRADGEEIVHVVLETGDRVPEARLKEILTATLPATFQAQVYYVAALPRNNMGKIRRDVLRRQLGLA